MKKVGKPVFFIVVLLIAVLAYLSFFGIAVDYGDTQRKYIKGSGDIRWGIDIRGGVDVTFGPPEGTNATDEQMAAAESIIKVRLVSQKITDSEVYTDYGKDRIIVRFPWKADEKDFNPELAINELGQTALLTFREQAEIDEATGLPIGVTRENIVLEGKDIKQAAAAIDPQNNYPLVTLELTPEGATKFAVATEKMYKQNGQISIWMDETMISAPSVDAVITDGKAVIQGGFTPEEAKSLADKINAGALPFKLTTENFSSISPTLGMGAKDAMVMAGAIAFFLVAIFITLLYRLPGAIATISLLGQVAGTVAAITGFFVVFPSFTLTLPGIAGIILAIGIGVDANIITSERIKEELRAGKTVDGAIEMGYKRAFTAVFDGNVSVVIVAVVLMGAFGPPGSMFSKLLYPIFAFFGPSTAGAIYSFGYTLLVGVLLNFVFGIMASRLMLKSISKFKAFKNPWLYGGAK